MSPDADDPRRYRFGPLERRGLVAGWRGGQIATIAVGLLFAVVVIRAAPSLVGAGVALVLVGVAVVTATWPIGGRTAEEWAPDALRHAAALTARRVRRPAGAFGSLNVLGTADETGRPGPAVIHDRATRTFTAVMRVSSHGFALAGEDDKVARVSSWSAVLSGMARQGTVMRRLQWVARALPDDGSAVRRHFASAAVVGAHEPAHRSYASLLQGETTARAHEVLVALTIGGSRSGRDVGATCRQVTQELVALQRQLIGAGIDCREPLTAAELYAAVRTAASGSAVATRRGSEEPRTRWPWPMAIEEHWDRMRADDTWHACYWIAEWPRRDVGPDFLGPLLVADVRRSVSMVMEPVSALEATRRVEQARTADIADAELRRRGGFLATARRRREEEVLAQRELELADGHAHFRFAGYVTVTAGDPVALDEACDRTEQAAARAGLELRRCYGAQGRAFACTMPLGRGLP